MSDGDLVSGGAFWSCKWGRTRSFISKNLKVIGTSASHSQISWNDKFMADLPMKNRIGLNN
jgi:hypothetical protein